MLYGWIGLDGLGHRPYVQLEHRWAVLIIQGHSMHLRRRKLTRMQTRIKTEECPRVAESKHTFSVLSSSPTLKYMCMWIKLTSIIQYSQTLNSASNQPAPSLYLFIIVKTLTLSLHLLGEKNFGKARMYRTLESEKRGHIGRNYFDWIKPVLP